jgi:hypothetical protein
VKVLKSNLITSTMIELYLNSANVISKAGSRHAVAQAVSCWLPTAAARVHFGQHVGFVVDKAALGQVFSEYFGFPCQSFHQFLHHHNHPGLAQQAYWWPQCQVDQIGLHPHYTNF